MPKKTVAPEVRYATANVAFWKFLDNLAEDPPETIRNAAFGFADGRICFCDKDLMPDWVIYEIDVDGGAPISSKEVVRVFDRIDVAAIEALVATMYICGDGDLRDFVICLRLDQRRREFETAFRALVPTAPVRAMAPASIH